MGNSTCGDLWGHVRVDGVYLEGPFVQKGVRVVVGHGKVRSLGKS